MNACFWSSSASYSVSRSPVKVRSYAFLKHIGKDFSLYSRYFSDTGISLLISVSMLQSAERNQILSLPIGDRQPSFHVLPPVSWTPHCFPHSGHLNLDPFWKSIQMSTLLSSWSNLISLIYHGSSRPRSFLNSSSGFLCYNGEIVYYLPANSWRDPLNLSSYSFSIFFPLNSENIISHWKIALKRVCGVVWYPTGFGSWRPRSKSGQSHASCFHNIWKLLDLTT